MSREIKFRAYCDIGEESKMVYFNALEMDNGLWFSCPPNIVHIDEYLSPIMQFVGMKDKNGVEVYEGDILKTFWQHDGVNNYDYDFVGEVQFLPHYLQFGIRGYGVFGEVWYPLCSFEREELFGDETEVIGNIYQSNELLTQTKEP